MSEVKHVYLIRHAETTNNRQHTHQLPTEPLNEVGQKQAIQLADFLTDKNIETLISSNYKRALETTEVVSAKLDLPYTIEKSVREFDVPVSLHNRNYLSLPSIIHFIKFYFGRNRSDWSLEHGENMTIIRQRVADTKKMLEANSTHHIAVISHRIFITSFAETVCFNRPLSLLRFVFCVLGKKRQIPNTAIYHFIVEPSANNFQCNWLLQEIFTPPYTPKDS